MSKKEYQARYREKNRERLRENMRQVRRSFRNSVFDHYGRECVWCGYDDERALQIDHIADNGAEERARLGGKSFSGWRFYQYLVKLGYPDGYQTLCANCNNIKQWEKRERGRMQA